MLRIRALTRIHFDEQSLPGFYETLLQMTIANILVTPCAVERSLREYKDEYLEEKVSLDPNPDPAWFHRSVD
jgi:hypothetical protein